MLAICSDLDETPDRVVYRDIVRFLNTTQQTSMGEGLGLEVGNSIYFDMPSDQFAYWNTDETGRQMIRTLIHSGHIDCLHSFGDLATTRSHAARAIEELCRHNCRLEVWVDHATAPTNFGADIMRGYGDLPHDRAYHADLTIDYGIGYVWRGRVTSRIGQNTRPRLAGLLRAEHPLVSARTVAKEVAKGLLGSLGYRRYSMHAPNRVLRRTALRDGHAVYEFLRSNPHFAGVSCGETGRGIGQVLTERILQHLADRSGVCVLYTHLGKIHSYDTPLDASAVEGLRRLARAHHDSRILVTTTQRLLRYCRTIAEVAFAVHQRDGHARIDLREPGLSPRHTGQPWPARLDGLTFYLPQGRILPITVNGQDVPEARFNPPDHTGTRSVSLPWPRLEMPDL